MANRPARDSKGRLLPGTSLNAGGRRKLPENVRVAIHDTGVEAMVRLSEIITDGSAFGPKGWLAGRDQLKAIEVATDRAFGRPDLARQEDEATPDGFDPTETPRILRAIIEAAEADGSFSKNRAPGPAALLDQTSGRSESGAAVGRLEAPVRDGDAV